MSSGKIPGMLKTVLMYGFALAAGAVVLQWLEYQIWTRTHAGTVHIAHLFEKLRVARRTEAILLARELGLVP